MAQQITTAETTNNPLDQVKNFRAVAHNASNEIWFAIAQLSDRAACPELGRIVNTQWRRIDMNRLHEIVPGRFVPGVVVEESFATRHGLVEQILEKLRRIKGHFDLTHEQVTALRAFCLMYKRLRHIIESDNAVVLIEADTVIKSSVRIRMDFRHLTEPEDGYLKVIVNNLLGSAIVPNNYRYVANCPL